MDGGLGEMVRQPSSCWIRCGVSWPVRTREVAATWAIGMVPKQGRKGNLSIPLDRLPREEVSSLVRSRHTACSLGDTFPSAGSS